MPDMSLPLCRCGGETERGTEDNLPHAVGFKKGKGGQCGEPPTPARPSSLAQSSEYRLHLHGGVSGRRGDGRAI